MDYQTLKYDIDDGLLLLTLNRPDQLNAFTVQMADELVAAYERASLDDAVRVIVVTGAGKAFCAGMDLSTGGNVFGLDESQAPTLQDVRERLEDRAIHRSGRERGRSPAGALGTAQGGAGGPQVRPCVVRHRGPGSRQR